MATTRRDAVENRKKITLAAGQLLREQGSDFSISAVAQKAGVGVGTLYRNFATKEDLLAEVLDADRLEKLADQLSNTLPPAPDALRQWLTAFAQWNQTYPGFTTAFRDAALREGAPLAGFCQWAEGTIDRFLPAAQSAGMLPSGVTARQLYLTALSLSWAANDDYPVESLLDPLFREV